MRGLDTRIAEAGARHGDRLVLLTSFQKEESVLIDAAVRVAPLTRFVTIDTGVLFPETLTAWRAFEERYGIDVEVEDARGDWSADNCCSDAKVAALERALSGAEAWVTGIRREQSPTRAHAELVERDEARGLVKYNPLADWTEQDLWRVIRGKELPYNKLHDQGYASIGCAPCTAPGKGREGRWAGTDKLECGIHVLPARPAAA
jgi:phosphoadenosine phosphosulfate reductase